MACEKWERKKRYLFRNLLAEPGYRLSPVTEESLSDNLVDGPYSPLPDLIIEPEPNRHDEPPEFYQGLEVRMRRLYKQIFLEDRESSVETEGLINVGEEIDVHQSHDHQEIYRETSVDSEILNPNNTLKDIQNVPKSVETKNKPSEAEIENSPIISFGRRALRTGNKANVKNMTKTHLDFTDVQFIANEDSKENKEIQNKSKNFEAEGQLNLENSYVRAFSVENISNETELTESDMDFTQVILNPRNISEEILETENKSSKTEDDRSTLGFGNPITFGIKPLSVDENKTTETEVTVSDVDDTHVILTTVVEIHEEPLSGKTFVCKTKSPILIPTRHKASSKDLRALTENTKNISLVDKAKNKNKSEDVNQTDVHNVENINENNERQATDDQSDNTLDLEVESILQNAEAVSNSDRMCDVDRDTEKTEEVSSKGEDLFAFLNPKDESASEERNEGTIRSNGPPRKRSRDTENDTDNSFEMALRKCVFERLNKKRTSDQSSEVEIKTEEESRSEEIIDSNEYDTQRKRNELQLDDNYRDISNDDEYGSFESAIRLEAFRRITRRKGFGQVPEESDSAGDETEVVEEMRGAPLVEPLQAFQRKSTASQESLQGLFAKPSVAEIPEDISIGVEEHNMSVEALNRTREERFFQDSVGKNSPVLGGFTAHMHTVAEFQKDTSACDEGHMNMSQEENSLHEKCVEEKIPVFGRGYIAHKHKVVHFQADISNSNEEHVNVSPVMLQGQNSFQEESMEQKSSVQKRASMSKTKPTKSFPDEVKESSVSTEEATPSAPANNLMSTLCGEIWSVSPIPINTADFSNATSSNTEVYNENLATKRRQLSSSSVPKKRKKCQNKSVRASTEPDPWEALKSNFFVGTPRIFKLCSCPDHTCQ